VPEALTWHQAQVFMIKTEKTVESRKLLFQILKACEFKIKMT
jgi:hypothetical protein